MRRLSIITLMLMLVGCYNAADKPHFTASLPEANTTIERFQKQYVGSRAMLVEDDVIVQGRVTSSDAENNFYRTIVVEDETAAIEVLVGLNSLSKSYPEGLLVALRMKDTYVGKGYGILQLGRKADSYSSYVVDYLGSREAVDIVVKRSTDVRKREPAELTIADLDDTRLGRLIRIGGLHLVRTTSIDTLEGETLYDARWGGYSLFKDKSGDSIAVYTRPYANFAERHIPNEEISLCGILQYGKYNGGRECYQLKLRYAEDCQIY